MLLHPPLNKNGKQFSRHTDDFHKPSAHNPLFQQELFFLGCPYCVGRGRKKNFRTLWKLYMEIRLNHEMETENFQPIIWSLANFVLRGIIK